MTEQELRKEARRQRRLEKLGTNDPRCGVCGEKDYRCLELHHVAGRRWDDQMVAICRNCHQKVTDDQKEHPRFTPASDPALDSIGHFLFGLADLLRLIVEKLAVFGTVLIERASAPVAGDAA